MSSPSSRRDHRKTLVAGPESRQPKTKEKHRE